MKIIRSWNDFVISFFLQKAMDDTFYLSNIVPQDIDNNAGFWNRFEMYCRDLAKRFDSVQVVSGPMVLPSTLNDRGQRVVTYPVTIVYYCL